MNGVPLDHRLVVLAACNPYRKKPASLIKDATPGLAYSYPNARNSPNPNSSAWIEDIQSLVYAVHPLPETMKQLVWDFGILRAEDEKYYIQHIVRNSDALFPDPMVNYASSASSAAASATSDLISNLQALLSACIEQSQNFMRDKDKLNDPTDTDPSGIVSLRDVIRTVQLFKWFYTQHHRREVLALSSSVNVKNKKGGVFASLMDVQDYIKLVKTCMVLSLAFNYYFRLNKKLRVDYANMVDKLLKLKGTQQFGFLIDAEEKYWVNQLTIPPNTSLNQALLENIFVLIVCIYNVIPVFVQPPLVLVFLSALCLTILFVACRKTRHE